MRLVLGPNALAELGDGAAFYASRGGTDLGSLFVNEFSVIYQITAEEIRVIAIAHQRRRPGYWARRK